LYFVFNKKVISLGYVFYGFYIGIFDKTDYVRHMNYQKIID